MKPAPAVQIARKLYAEALVVLADQDGVHLQTACALLGAMVGMALYRKHVPSDHAASDLGSAAASAIIENDAPNILAALDRLANDAGIKLSLNNPVDIDASQTPLLPPAELLQRHGERLWATLNQQLLSPEDRLLASLFALLYFVQQSARFLSLPVASALILEGFRAGSNTPPHN